jgi:hypothetical protein
MTGAGGVGDGSADVTSFARGAALTGDPVGLPGTETCGSTAAQAEVSATTTKDAQRAEHRPLMGPW